MNEPNQFGDAQAFIDSCARSYGEAVAVNVATKVIEHPDVSKDDLNASEQTEIADNRRKTSRINTGRLVARGAIKRYGYSEGYVQKMLGEDFSDN